LLPAVVVQAILPMVEQVAVSVVVSFYQLLKVYLGPAAKDGQVLAAPDGLSKAAAVLRQESAVMLIVTLIT